MDIAHRKRRDSHRGYPDLSQTHTISIGGSVAVAQSFTRTDQAVTFKCRFDRTSATATGTLFTLGDQGSVGFQNGELRIETGGSIFLGAFPGAPIDSAELVVAIKPTTGEVRAWVDSDCVISGEILDPFPYSWATSGNVAYDSTTGVEAISDLDAFELQLPRHFDECGDITTPTPSTCPILFNAAHATQLATSEVPFLCIN